MANVAQEQLRGCAATGLFAARTFSLFTRVTLSHEGTEWVARSATISDGTVELRFHDTGGGTSLFGTIAVGGTLRGSAASIDNDRFSGKSFLSFSGTAGTGTATLEGSTGTPRSPTIVFGTATGSFIFTDGFGGIQTCSSLNEWSLQPRTD